MFNTKDKLEELRSFYCDLYAERTPNCKSILEIDLFHRTLDTVTTKTNFSAQNTIIRPLGNPNTFTNYTK